MENSADDRKLDNLELVIFFQQNIKNMLTYQLVHTTIYVYIGDKKMKLTPKQHAILKYIHFEMIHQGFQPSQREVAKKFRIDIAAVSHHLRACEKKRYIELTGMSRAIKFLKKI